MPVFNIVIQKLTYINNSALEPEDQIIENLQRSYKKTPTKPNKPVKPLTQNKTQKTPTKPWRQAQLHADLEQPSTTYCKLSAW